MSPARTLMTQLSGSGVTLRLDGDAIVHRGPRHILTPEVLAKLRRLKIEIVAELRRQDEIGLPCTLNIAGGNACKRAEAHPGKAGSDDWFTKSEPLKARILAALDRLPAPCSHDGRRLIAETRRFLECPWWTEAIMCGWTLEELFGVDENAPLDNHDGWGLIVGLAWAPKRGDAIEHLDAEHSVIRYFPGSTMKNARRIERRFMPTDSMVVWWECTALMGDVDHSTSCAGWH